MFIPQDIYDQICRMMPIPCVDLFVTDKAGRVLLLLRSNEPAKDQWWFPGGRVLYNETRQQSVIRKLQEECGLTPLKVEELGTYDLILDLPYNDLPSHAITTLYHVVISGDEHLKVDDQSLKAEWKFPKEWIGRNLHEFVKNHILLWSKTE